MGAKRPKSLVSYTMTISNYAVIQKKQKLVGIQDEMIKGLHVEEPKETFSFFMQEKPQQDRYLQIDMG